MKRSLLITTLALVAPLACALPLTAGAQGYAPPKLLKQGTYTTPIAGTGTVIVQVLVNPDGSFKVQKVIKSTNHADEAAALEIARTSKYKPAMREGKPTVAFYDFSLKFTGKSVSNADSGAGGGTLARYNAMINAGNYAGAKAGLAEYLAAHPGDQQASLALGAADALARDYGGAVKAFDAAGSIPQKYAGLAGLSYAQYATQQSNAKNGTEAMAAARKAVQISPNVATYNALGLAALGANDGASAVDAFQRAASMAANDPKAANKIKATIQANLAAAYSQTGALDKAKAAAAEAQRLDPSSSAGQVVVANTYIKQAQDLETAGKFADAAAQWEQAAAAYPSQAVTFYGRAASNYLNVKPNPDPVKAKAAADKALAIAPNDAAANFYAGIAVADQGKAKDALTYLNKADAAAKAANNTTLADAIEKNIKQLSGAKP